MKKILSHDPSWTLQFEAEVKLLTSLLGVTCVEIHHMGSTAIANIPAKPIIDILMEVSALEKLDLISTPLVESGYEARGEYGITGRRYFKKRAICKAAPINLHCYKTGSFEIKRHLAFRDYLNLMPHIAQEYAQLKLSLSDDSGVLFPHYKNVKKPFVDSIALEALKYFE